MSLCDLQDGYSWTKKVLGRSADVLKRFWKPPWSSFISQNICLVLLCLYRPASSSIVIITSKWIIDNYRGVDNIIYFTAAQDMIRVNVGGSVGAWKAARGEVERESWLSFSFLFYVLCESPEIPNSLNSLPRCLKGNLYNFRCWELREGQTTIWYLNLPPWSQDQ